MLSLPLVLLHFSALVQCLPHQTPLGNFARHQPADPFDNSFNAIAENAMDDLHVLGFSVSVVDGDQTFARGYGYSALPNVNATADTLYFVGSTTKSFTAASILRLIEQSEGSAPQLSLETKIASLIDWKLQDEYATAHITLEDALSHRTGFARHDFSYGGPNATVKDIIKSLPYLPMVRELRQEFQYCNIMFIIVSDIIERLSHSKLGDFFKTHFWEPLGMNSTFLNLQEALDTGLVGTGYFYDNGTKTYVPDEYMDTEFVAGAGGIISSVTDYATYLRAIMREDSRLLSKASYLQLRTARSLGDPTGVDGLFTGPSAYSLGWMISVYRGVEVFHHPGGVPGFATMMMYVPELDWAVALMANADLGGGAMGYYIGLELLDRRLGSKTKKGPNMVKVWNEILESRVRFLGNVRKLTFPEAPPLEEAINHTLPLDAYTGSYYHPAYHFVNLTLAAPPKYVGVPVPSENNRILHAEVTDRMWPHVLDFEHLNADHFFVRFHFLKNATSFDVETAVMRADFRIGIDGKVSEMGLAFELSKGDELLWFKKVK